MQHMRCGKLILIGHTTLFAFVNNLEWMNKQNPIITRHLFSDKNLDEKVQDEVERNFSKKFEFFQDDDDDHWSLPDPKKMFQNDEWEDENLSKLKWQLNELKQQLNDKDIELWRRHTENVAVAGLVKHVVKDRIKPELFTQAWLKFYEILSNYPLIGQTENTKSYLGTVHLCEAPGAFVAALNHYVQTHRSNIQEWKWLATTLNPYYEGNSMGATVVDDRLILPTLPNWHFGADNTGNIMCKGNRKSLSERANKELQQVSLITADGSIDCQENPSEQEEMVSNLHLSETATALRILDAGGHFVLKMFTFFEHTSVCIMYLLNCSFEKVHVFKPGTSKPGNSEVYVIAINYRGSNAIKEYIEVLENHTECELKRAAMFSREDLHPSYLQQLRGCAEFFKEHQQVAIETNLMLFQNIRMVNKQQHDSVRHCAAKFYIENYKVRPILEGQRLVQQNLQAKVSEFTRARRGSLNGRRKVATMNRDERIAMLDSQLRELNKDKVDVSANIIIQLPQNGNSREDDLPSDPLMGKTFKDIIGSPFCSRHLLILWRDLCSFNVKIGSRLENDIGSLVEEILKISENFKKTKIVNCSSDSHVLSLLCQKMKDDSVKEEELRSTTYVMGPICNDLDSFLSPANDVRATFETMKQMSFIFQVITENDNTIILFHNTVTRVYAGLIFLLNSSFRQVFLVSAPTGPPILVCCRFQELSTNKAFLLRKLAEVVASTPDAESETSVLEIVPYGMIAGDRALADTLDAFNNRYLMQKCLVAIESLKMDAATAATMLTE